VIVVAIRWYLRYGLSYRDVEELLVERGVEVDHVTVFRWVQRFTPLLADAAKFCRHSPGDRWFVDETYVKVNGVWRYVYRAVDQHRPRCGSPWRSPNSPTRSDPTPRRGLGVPADRIMQHRPPTRSPQRTAPRVRTRRLTSSDEVFGTRRATIAAPLSTKWSGK
jgi:hypothetical protein